MSSSKKGSGNPAKKGYHSPQKKWDELCPTCRNKPFINLKAEIEPCPRCGGIRKK